MKKELKKSLTVLASDVLRITYDANEERIKSRLSDAQFRKVRKLANNPELFVKDVITKKKEQARKYLPIKYDGNFNYTVVSAVYNVEKYLDEYFESLVNQSLDFKKHIHLILVDDGSTDNSAQIIKKWQKKYPKNIHYYYKENGGQASARNLGLQYVETEWVTFIDPDDFVNADYFKNTDDVLSQDSNVKMLVANTIFYMESKKEYKDGHPLRFRFHQKDKKFAIKNLGKNINLSVAASIFATDVIREYELAFDDLVKPNFEDGKFIGEFLLHAHDGDAWFSDDVIYYYRKRDDSSSTLDTAWQKPQKYSNVLEYGFLALLEKYRLQFGSVPVNIQMTALYDMYWYLVYLLNQPEKIDFLSDEQKQKYYQLYDEVMSFIDTKTIMDFGIAGAWFFHKVGFLGAFKGEKPPFQICYIEAIDKEKQQVLISYFDCFEEPAFYLLDGVDTVPQYAKNVLNTFNDKLFVYEKRVWIAYDNLDQKLSVKIYGKPARLALKALAHKPEYKIVEIAKVFTSEKYQSDGSWLLMDRETKADDNAEHLYRYLMNHYPEQVCYFALNRDSSDWDRLADEGFKLVAFGKPEFETRLAKADKIISSHIEAHVHNYFGDLYAGTKKFVFLQHGVIKDNLSRWLNGKKHVACFVTTTKDEYQSIAFGERYKFSEKEVVQTGLPRHDELYRKNQNAEESKVILIMPTWRSYLMGETVGKGANTRTLNPKFLESSYATHWSALLHSDKLKALVDEHGYQVIFAPHANIEPYLSQMNLPSYLTIWSASQASESMQDLFVRASMMITDYSSVAFEMAYIGKPTLYYQFDKDEFFSGSHSYQKGYFDYKQHGFGAVSYDEESLLAELASVLTDGVGAEYQHRINNTFAHRDDGNCERVYQAIKALDEPEENTINLKILREMIESADRHQDWKLLIERAEKFLANKSDDLEIQLLLIQALTQTKQWRRAQEAIEFYAPKGADKFALPVAFATYDWQGVVSAYQNVEPSFKLSYQYLQALIKLDNKLEAMRVANQLLQGELLENERLAVLLTLLDLQGQYELVLEFSDKVVVMDTKELSILKPQLLLAKAHRLLGNHDLAHAQLVAFEQHTKDDVDCRLEIAKLAFARERYEKCIAQFERLIGINYPLTATEQKLYLDAVFLVGQYDKYVTLFDNIGSDTDNQTEYQIVANNQAFRVAYIRQDWQSMVSHYSQSDTNFIDVLLYVQALQKLDQPQKAKVQLNAIQNNELVESEQLLVNLLQLDFDEKYQEASELTEQITQLPTLQKKLFKPQLLLAKAHRLLGNHDLAHAQLVAFEQHTKDDVDCRLEIAKLAFARERYEKCIAQFERLIGINYPLTATEQKLYLDAVFLVGQYDKYVTLFDNIGSDTDNQTEYQIVANNQAFRVAYIRQDWQSMVSHYSQSDTNFIDVLLYVQALQKLDQPQKAKVQLNAIQNNELVESEQLLVNLLQLDFDEKYQEASELTEQITQLPTLQKKLFKPQLLLAKAHRLLGNHDLAHAQLVAFEQHTKDDVDCRLEIAKLAFVREHYGKCVNQLEKLLSVGYPLNVNEQKLHLHAVYLAGQFTKYIEQFERSNVSDADLQIAYVKSLVRETEYKTAIQYANEQQLTTESELAYELTLAKYRLGLVEEVYQSNIQLTANDSYEYWMLVAEIAWLMGDKELEKRCYRGMISIYPNKNKQTNMEKLAALR